MKISRIWWVGDKIRRICGFEWGRGGDWEKFSGFWSSVRENRNWCQSHCIEGLHGIITQKLLLGSYKIGKNASNTMRIGWFCKYFFWVVLVHCEESLVSSWVQWGKIWLVVFWVWEMLTWQERWAIDQWLRDRWIVRIRDLLSSRHGWGGDYNWTMDCVVEKCAQV